MNVESLIQVFVTLDREIKEAEDRVNRLRSQRHLLVTSKIPEAMASFGSSMWENDRYVCKVDFKVTGSLPKDEDRRAAALHYLDDLGESNLLTADLDAKFTKGGLKEAKRMANIIRDKAETLKEAKVDIGVHFMTLQAMARARVREGKPIRLELLGLDGVNTASIREKS